MKIYRLLKSLINIKKTTTFNVGEAIPYKLPDIAFKYITNQNLKDVEDFRDKRYISTFRKFLDNDEKGLYGYYNGRCIVHGWVVYNTTFKTKKVCGYFKLPPKSCFIHFCNVAEDMRGKGIYKALLYQIYKRLCNGYNIYIDTGKNNFPALKAIETSGAKRIFQLITINLRSHCIISFKKHE